MLGKAIINDLTLKEDYQIFYISYSQQVLNTSACSLTLEDLQNHIFYAFFHCAAEVDVNLCEKNYNYAIKSNSEYTRILFEKVITQMAFYISTDSVYEGNLGDYKEFEKVNPLNNYAKSKLMGEIEASNLIENLFTIRTNIFGNNSKSKSSLFEWAKRELELGNSINGFTNILFNPLSVEHLSEILIMLMNENLPFGIYNLGSSEYISKYDFLLKVANFIGCKNISIIPSKYEYSNTTAKRPLNTTLNCMKIKKYLGNVDLSIDKSFNLLKNKFEHEKN